MLSCEDTHNKRCCGRAKPEASGCKTLVIEADRAACGDSGEVRIRAYCEKGWGGIASSVIGNVRVERDDRGLAAS